MAITLLPTYSSTTNGDTAASANSVVVRDGSANIAAAQVLGSELKTSGTFVLPTVAKTSSFTADATATVYLCDATSGAQVATLPASAGVTGRVYSFRKTDSGGNAVTVTGAGAETIDASNTKALSSQYKTIIIISDGTKWHILASF